MAVWGNAELFIEKDVQQRCWIVYTAILPHRHLVTIPFSDAFRNISPKSHPDYAEAISTCQSDELMALTRIEEVEARRAASGAEPSHVAPLRPPEPTGFVEQAVTEPMRVISLDDFRRRTRTLKQTPKRPTER